MKALTYLIVMIATFLASCNESSTRIKEIGTKDTFQVTNPLAIIETNATQDTITEKKVEKQEPKQVDTPLFAKNELNEYETYMELVKDDSIKFETPVLAAEGRKYVVQLSCIRDLKRLQKEQQKLLKYGYETVISKRAHDGIFYYRLRIKGKMTRDDAYDLGEEIKDKFLNITDYLVLKTK